MWENIWIGYLSASDCQNTFVVNWELLERKQIALSIITKMPSSKPSVQRANLYLSKVSFHTTLSIYRRYDSLFRHSVPIQLEKNCSLGTEHMGDIQKFQFLSYLIKSSHLESDVTEYTLKPWRTAVSLSTDNIH